MKLTKTEKILIYTLPLLLMGGIAYAFIRKKQGIKNLTVHDYTPPKASNPTVEPTANTIATTNVYPLKSGSKGAMVVELQQILNGSGAGLTVDGKFGPKTQAALQKAYGKTQIDSAADYNNFKAKTQSQADKNTSYSRAITLLNAYNQNPAGSIYTTLETTMRVIIVNSDNTYTDSGQTITFDKLDLFPRERFVPKAASTNGELRAEYTTPFIPVTFAVLANPSALAVKY